MWRFFLNLLLAITGLFTSLYNFQNNYQLFIVRVCIFYKYVNTRCDQKITVIQCSMFKKSIYLFINNYPVPLKVTPLRYKTFMPAFFLNPILKTHLKRGFWYRQQLVFRFSFISSVVAKRFPFIGVFNFGERKKSAGSKSGECDGMITVLFLAKNSRTSIDVQFRNFGTIFAAVKIA